MKKSRFNEEQVARIVRESDAAGVPATAKKHAIGEQTLCLWRRKFGSLEASDVKRLKQLEIENGGLKKMVARRLDHKANIDARTAKRVTPSGVSPSLFSPRLKW
jgi:putative transposase